MVIVILFGYWMVGRLYLYGRLLWVLVIFMFLMWFSVSNGVLVGLVLRFWGFFGFGRVVLFLFVLRWCMFLFGVLILKLKVCVRLMCVVWLCCCVLLLKVVDCCLWRFLVMLICVGWEIIVCLSCFFVWWFGMDSLWFFLKVRLFLFWYVWVVLRFGFYRWIVCFSGRFGREVCWFFI